MKSFSISYIKQWFAMTSSDMLVSIVAFKSSFIILIIMCGIFLKDELVRGMPILILHTL